MKKFDPNTIIANRTIKDILSRFETKIYKQPRPLDGKKSVEDYKRIFKIKMPNRKSSKIIKRFFKKKK